MGTNVCSKHVTTIQQARDEAEEALGNHILCLKNSIGDELWAVKDTPEGFMIYVCFVFKFQEDWAYKWVSEVEGPMSIDCPAGILNLARGTKPHYSMSAEWRHAIGL